MATQDTASTRNPLTLRELLGKADTATLQVGVQVGYVRQLVDLLKIESRGTDGVETIRDYIRKLAYKAQSYEPVKGKRAGRVSALNLNDAQKAARASVTGKVRRTLTDAMMASVGAGKLTEAQVLMHWAQTDTPLTVTPVQTAWPITVTVSSKDVKLNQWLAANQLDSVVLKEAPKKGKQASK